MRRARRALALVTVLFLVTTSCHSIRNDAFAHGPVSLEILPLREPITYTVGPQAGQPVPAQNGLLGSYFNGAQYVDPSHNEYLVYQQIDPNINFSWDASDTNPVIPADKGGIDHNDGDFRLPDHWPIWSIVWEGYLGVPADGSYTFRLHVNNGGWLEMKDGSGGLSTVISCPGGSGFEGDCDSAPLSLTAGRRYIRISYFNNAPSSANAFFSWRLTDPAAPDFAIVPTSALFTQAAFPHAPQLTPLLDAKVKLGGALERVGAFVDTDAGDSWTATVDYGDGGGAQPLVLATDQTFALFHRYVKEGVFTVRVVVTDSTGLQGESSLTVTAFKPPKPVTTTSWYVHTMDKEMLRSQGCAEATRAKNAKPTPLTDGFVILFFGKADKSVVNGKDVYGTIPWFSAFKSTTDIADAAEAYLTGLYNCSDKDAYFEVALGTSNCTFDPVCVQSETTFAHGKAWAEMVRDVNVWLADCAGSEPAHCFRSKILVQGGNDMELAWETAANTASWAKGFDSVHAAFYYDFGAADGCPSLGWEQQGSADGTCAVRTRRCLTCDWVIVRWRQSEVAYVAWDNPSALPTPQIYLDDEQNAMQWYRISLQYALTHDGVPIEFPAPLSERRACEQNRAANGLPDTAPLPADCITPSESWNQMWKYLWGNPATYTHGDLSFRWSTDIGKMWLQ